MMGLISIFKVIFGFLFVCLLGGLFFYTIFDLKPWRRDSQLWDKEKGPLPLYLRFKKFAQQKINIRSTWLHIKAYYMYYGLALIIIYVAFSD